ncbi:MAG: fructosamine kinase family protein [Rhodospirillales bacterium]|nr:fructosamine kinase family protein [Rhodospirillales bacterium]
MDRCHTDIISEICRSPVRSIRPLSGGCIAAVFQVTLENGTRIVAKAGNGAGVLTIEGRMLGYLAAHTELPVPAVLYASARLLLIQHCRHEPPLTALSEADAARHLGKLHALSADHFGFEWNTLIGPLDQPNPKTERWIPFFRDHRLLYMAGLANQAGRLPNRLLDRVLLLAEDLPDFLLEPDQPSLIHGDLWAGNMLCYGNKISAFIDPALYFADAEIELAYATLFASVGDAFFDAYQQLRPLKPGFFEARRDLYNLYPLLVHVRLFGGHYVASVEATLERYGY